MLRIRVRTYSWLYVLHACLYYTQYGTSKEMNPCMIVHVRLADLHTSILVRVQQQQQQQQHIKREAATKYCWHAREQQHCAFLWWYSSQNSAKIKWLYPASRAVVISCLQGKLQSAYTKPIQVGRQVHDWSPGQRCIIIFVPGRACGIIISGQRIYNTNCRLKMLAKNPS